MDPHTVMALIVTVGGGFVVVWVLQKIGKALAAILEALAADAMVFLALWLVVKTTWWLVKTAVMHWRTTLTLASVLVWLVCWGWLSLAITVVSVGWG